MIFGVLTVLVEALARSRMPMLESAISLGGDEHVGRLQGRSLGPPSHSGHGQRRVIRIKGLQGVGEFASRHVIDPAETVTEARSQVPVIGAKPGGKDSCVRIAESRPMNNFAHDSSWLVDLLLTRSGNIAHARVTSRITIAVVDGATISLHVAIPRWIIVPVEESRVLDMLKQVR